MKPIFIAASPNTQKDDIWITIKQLLQPWNWFGTTSVKVFEEQVSAYLEENVKALAFDSARSAFYLILQAYGIKKEDEVILPSFSCLVVANPVKWVGASPVYADIDKETFNIDYEDLEDKVSDKTRAVLVQHTFGMPVDIPKIRKIVGKDVKIIEDVAHSLGGTLNGQKLGTLGDAAILTFGIEKVISTVRGGMVVTKDKLLYEVLQKKQSSLPSFPILKLILSLINPIFWWLITPVYYVGIGKVTIGRILTSIAHKINLLGNMIEKCEYFTDKPTWIPAKMPNCLANLGLNQLKKLDMYNDHRIKIARIYQKELGENHEISERSKHIYLRVPLLVDNPEDTIRRAKKECIVLGDWYKAILYAPKESIKLLNYTSGDTPIAEEVASKIINLPTGINVSEEDAYRITSVIQN